MSPHRPSCPRVAGIALLLSSVAGASLARAAEPVPADIASTSSPDARAVELNDRGERLFRDGHYDEAAELFRQGYALEPNPTFLYNLALTYEKSGDYRRALDALRRYRKADPNAPDAVAIDAHIETLQELVAELDAEAPEPEVVVEVRREPGPLAGPLPWIIAGTGAAGALAGVVLGAVALERHEQAVDEPIHATAVDLQGEATTLSTAATVSLITGGAVAAVGLSLGVVGLATDDGDDLAVRLEGIDVGLGQVRLRGSF